MKKFLEYLKKGLKIGAFMVATVKIIKFAIQEYGKLDDEEEEYGANSVFVEKSKKEMEVDNA